MTAPGDDLEKALREALAAAVDQVAPGEDGLHRIRHRIGTRPPQPWLLSVLAGAVDRIRSWTWHGHWAWPDWLPNPASVPRPRLLRLPQPGAQGGEAVRAARPGAGSWLRPLSALAAIAVVVGVSLSVQPVRQAIIAASNTVLTPGGTPTGGAGTEGVGIPDGTGGGLGALVTSSRDADHPAAAPTITGQSPRTVATAACLAVTAGSRAEVKPSTPATAATPKTSCTPSASASPTSSASATPTATPSASATPTTGTGTPNPTPTLTPTPATTTPTPTSDSPAPSETDSSADGGTGDQPQAPVGSSTSPSD